MSKPKKKQSRGVSQDQPREGATSIKEFQRMFFPVKGRDPIRLTEPNELGDDADVVGRVLKEFRRTLAA